MKKLMSIVFLLMAFNVLAAGDKKAPSGVGETPACGSKDRCGNCINQSTTPPQGKSLQGNDSGSGSDSGKGSGV